MNEVKTFTYKGCVRNISSVYIGHFNITVDADSIQEACEKIKQTVREQKKLSPKYTLIIDENKVQRIK